jgi:hypothetical protein
MAEVTSGDLLGAAVRIDGVTDAGATVVPVGMFLAPDGGSLQPGDLTLTGVVPPDLQSAVMRATDDGGAVLFGRTLNPPQFGFVRFYAAGNVDPYGFHPVFGAAVPTVPGPTAFALDAATVSDAIVAVWSRQVGGRAEVHVVVAGPSGRLRLDQEVESFAGEGATEASAVPAYGGVALLWKRGVDAAARVRVAVVAPEGTVRVPPTDLVAAPDIDGRVVALADGRTVSFVARDGQNRAWGYTFGRACIPGM